MSKIEMIVDRRTELMSIIMLIGNYKAVQQEHIQTTNANKEYHEKIHKNFDAFKDHMAVQCFNDLIGKYNFTYDKPIKLAFSMDENFDFDKSRLVDLMKTMEEGGGFLSDVSAFLDELKEFAKDSKFDEFYEGNRPFYDRIVSDTKNRMNLDLIEKFNDEFYGEPFDCRCVINLLPAQTVGNYGFAPSGEIWANVSGRRGFDELVFFVEGNTPCLFVHEFSHNIINPMTQKLGCFPEGFFDDIRKNLHPAYKQHDVAILNDHLARAIEVIFNKHYFHLKEQGMQRFYHWNVDVCGFAYIPWFVDELEKYMSNRDKYKTLEEFYPVLRKNLVERMKNEETKA